MGGLFSWMNATICRPCLRLSHSRERQALINGVWNNNYFFFFLLHVGGKSTSSDVQDSLLPTKLFLKETEYTKQRCYFFPERYRRSVQQFALIYEEEKQQNKQTKKAPSLIRTSTRNWKHFDFKATDSFKDMQHQQIFKIQIWENQNHSQRVISERLISSVSSIKHIIFSHHFTDCMLGQQPFLS